MKTKTVNDNGWNPEWDEVFQFNLSAPELDIINFEIWDRDQTSDTLVGRSTFPVAAIREGYRAVGFVDPIKGNKIENAYLLCHFLLFDQ
jgi:Ca2+-dependent lipid-binding protein